MEKKTGNGPGTEERTAHAVFRTRGQIEGRGGHAGRTGQAAHRNLLPRSQVGPGRELRRVELLRRLRSRPRGGSGAGGGAPEAGQRAERQQAGATAARLRRPPCHRVVVDHPPVRAHGGGHRRRRVQAAQQADHRVLPPHRSTARPQDEPHDHGAEDEVHKPLGLRNPDHVPGTGRRRAQQWRPVECAGPGVAGVGQPRRAHHRQLRAGYHIVPWAEKGKFVLSTRDVLPHVPSAYKTNTFSGELKKHPFVVDVFYFL